MVGKAEFEFAGADLTAEALDRPQRAAWGRERSAKPYLLAHLLMILLLEPLVDGFEDSPTGNLPPDSSRRLAVTAPTRCNASTSHHPSADDCSPPMLHTSAAATSP